MHLFFPLISSLLYVAAALFLKQAAGRGVGPWRTSFVCNWITAGLFLTLLPTGGTIPSVALLWQPAAVAVLFVAGQLLTFLALDHGDVSVATPVMGVKVVLVAVFSTLLVDDPIRWQLWLAAAASTVGLAFLNRRPGAGAASPSTGSSPAGAGAGGTGAGSGAGRTIVLAFLAAASYALFDVLVMKWAPAWGSGRFLPVMLLFAAVLSCVFIPLSRGSLREVPGDAWRPLLAGSAFMALQALILISTLANFGDATAINVVYSTRGLWSVLAVWTLGHWFANREKERGADVLRGRLTGAALLCGAVVLVFV